VKKIILPFFLPLIFLLAKPILADFDQALSDFRYQLSEYATLHNNYQVSKANYLQFKSLPAEKDAFENTKKVLISRNKTLESYFFLLQEKLNQTQNSIETEDFLDVSQKIAQKEDFLKNQIQELEKAQIISQLETISKDLEGKIEEFKDLSEEASSLVILSQLRLTFQLHQDLQQKIFKVIEENPQAVKDKALIDRWMEESNNKAQNGIAERNKARETLHQFLQKEAYNKSLILLKLKEQLKTSKDFLQQAIEEQEQVIRKIQ